MGENESGNVVYRRETHRGAGLSNRLLQSGPAKDAGLTPFRVAGHREREMQEKGLRGSRGSLPAGDGPSIC